MGFQLKQALINAGLVPKEKLKEIDREKLKKLHVKDSPKMRKDQIRIVCEVCGKSAPDVEKYAHKNRKIMDKSWLCIPCADEHQIDDNCRVTQQSTQSTAHLFIRRYGKTKKFE